VFTAGDEFALRGSVNACAKPIRADRLAAALDKMRTLWTAMRAAAAPGGAGTKRSATDRVFLRDGDRCWIVTIAEIALFEGEGNYARVHFGSNRPLIRTSLNALEARLDPAVFFRASRRHLFNLRFVDRVDAGVDDGLPVTLSRVAMTSLPSAGEAATGAVGVVRPFGAHWSEKP
jgi:two-component system LytT family response regulator